MTTRLSKGTAGSLAAACIVVLAGSLVRAQQVDRRPGILSGPHALWVQAEADGPAVIAVSDHWIGVACRPAGDVLMKHLKLDHGLVVDQVMPDTPAEKAGVQQHDILLTMGDKPLKQVVDLVEAVKQAKDQETDLELIRGGKKKTVKVTPAKRDDTEFRLPPGVFPYDEAFKKWKESLPQGLPEQPLRWHRFHPGIVLPDGNEDEPEMPKGLSIAITKTGGEKANITVKRGDESWTTTEDKLDVLPEDVRPHVKRFLGRGSGIHLEFDASKFIPKDLEKQLPQLKQPWKIAPLPQIRVYRPKPGEHAERIERCMREQLKQMQRSLDEMHRQLDSLRADKPADVDGDGDVDVEIEVVPEKKKD